MTRAKAKPPTVDEIVGKRMAVWRVGQGLSQAQLAGEIGKGISQVSRYEKGQNAIDVTTLVAIARTLKCKPSDLLAEFEN